MKVWDLQNKKTHKSPRPVRRGCDDDGRTRCFAGHLLVTSTSVKWPRASGGKLARGEGVLLLEQRKAAKLGVGELALRLHCVMHCRRVRWLPHRWRAVHAHVPAEARHKRRRRERNATERRRWRHVAWHPRKQRRRAKRAVGARWRATHKRRLRSTGRRGRRLKRHVAALERGSPGLVVAAGE